MNFRRTIAVARKEFLHIQRDPRSLAMALAIPLVLLLLFGYALTLDVDREALDELRVEAGRQERLEYVTSVGTWDIYELEGAAIVDSGSFNAREK